MTKLGKPAATRVLVALMLCLLSGATLAQSRVARIGIIEFGGPPDGGFARAYLAALKTLGYSEPDTLRVERRYAQGDAERFPRLLQDLVGKVDLVFTVGNDIALVAKRAAPSLAVVTAGSDDPLMSGLIGDYRRPGGNVTGVTYLSPQLAAKRLELLKEAVPGMARVAVLWDPAHADTYYKDMLPAAAALGVTLQLFEVRKPQEIDGAFAAARKAGAHVVFVVPSRMVNLEARRIADLSLATRLPVMAAYANFSDAGGLISYGAVASDMLRRAAMQTANVLKGAKPGEVPFEQASTFELVLNLKTAKALGLKIPQSVLVRADRVIE
jgi:putative tryptophan/tyrosine transport system substrate-binding protein